MITDTPCSNAFNFLICSFFIMNYDKKNVLFEREQVNYTYSYNRILNLMLEKVELMIRLHIQCSFAESLTFRNTIFRQINIKVRSIQIYLIHKLAYNRILLFITSVSVLNQLINSFSLFFLFHYDIFTRWPILMLVRHYVLSIINRWYKRRKKFLR